MLSSPREFAHGWYDSDPLPRIEYTNEFVRITSALDRDCADTESSMWLMWHESSMRLTTGVNNLWPHDMIKYLRVRVKFPYFECILEKWIAWIDITTMPDYFWFSLFWDTLQKSVCCQKVCIFFLPLTNYCSTSFNS